MDWYDFAIHAVIGYLARTVKNPQSSKAQKLRHAVEELVSAGQEFLDATAPKV